MKKKKRYKYEKHGKTNKEHKKWKPKDGIIKIKELSVRRNNWHGKYFIQILFKGKKTIIRNKKEKRIW